MLKERINGSAKARPASAGRAAASQSASRQPIRIELHDEQAQSVSIIGTFNHWQTDETRMVRVQPGRWLRILFLPPGRYEYVFVVDGHFITDPNVAESVPNICGCANSVLRVSAPGLVVDGHSRRKPLRTLGGPSRLNRRMCRTNIPRHRHNLTIA